jgi:sortase A
MMPVAARARALLVLERVLFLLVLFFATTYAFRVGTRLATQQADRQALADMQRARELPGETGTPVAARGFDANEPARGSLFGMIEIPRLTLAATIRHGDDEGVLARAVGRIPGTSWRPAHGNIGLAGHRDTLFAPLARVRLGDVIRLQTAEGATEYRVTDIRVVGPDDVWVLDASSRPALTLVTCYPFTFVGRAPKRFIVRAELGI